jgi:N utilization substance protein B
MQAFYAYIASGNNDLKSGEVELNRNLNKFYELYLILFSLLTDVLHYTSERLEEGKKKFITSDEDLNPNTWLQDNYIAKSLHESLELNKELVRLKINTRGEKDLLHKIYQNVRNSEIYQKFVSLKSNDGSQEFFVSIFKEFIANEPTVSYYLEEQNIYFLGDLDQVAFLVIKTLKSWNENTLPQNQKLLPLYKDADDDYKFVIELFRKSILHRKEYETLIAKYTPNWESDRLAQMDVLLMLMALTEILHQPSIPIKVTMNEYIDISKEFSSINSKTFINGVLDKVVDDLKNENKIKKVGRGLIQ